MFLSWGAGSGGALGLGLEAVGVLCYAGSVLMILRRKKSDALRQGGVDSSVIIG